MSRRANKNIKEKKVEKKKKSIFSKILKILIILLIIAAVIAGGAYLAITQVMASIKGEDIEKTDIEKEIELYNNMATSLTKKEFDKVINIVIFGIDARPSLGDSMRSDTIIVASLNPTHKSIKLISIPRDTYVTLPGYKSKNKINAAYSFGREALAVKTINYNFGINIDEYITVDFKDVITIVNKIGGVEIDITEKERKSINKWSVESYNTSKQPYVAVSTAGIVNLTGEQALAYMRDRNSSPAGDFDRVTRQRDVMTQVINKISKMNLIQILKLTNTMIKGAKTNININEYFSYIPSFLAEKDQYLENIVSVQVPNDKYAKSQFIGGIYYFVPNALKMKEDMHELLYNK